MTYDTVYLFLPGEVPVEGGPLYLQVIISNTLTWKTSSGLVINGGTAYAGDTCNIYVRENSRYMLVKTFTLKLGQQTVIIYRLR